MKDELLIGMKPGTTAEEFLRLVNQIDGMVVGSVPELGIYQIRFPPNTNIDGLVQQLRQNPGRRSGAELRRANAPGRRGRRRVRRLRPPSGRRDGALPMAILDSGLSAQAGLQDWVVGSYDALRPDQALDDTAGHGTQMALIASGAVLPDGADGGEGLPLVAVQAFDDNGNASSYSLMRGLQSRPRPGRAGDMTAEAGRALQQFRAMADETRTVRGGVLQGHRRSQRRSRQNAGSGDTLLDAVEGDPGKFNVVADKLTKPRWIDKVTELRYFMLLSGPQTHAANIISNPMTALGQFPEHITAAGISMGRRAVMGADKASDRVYGS